MSKFASKFFPPKMGRLGVRHVIAIDILIILPIFTFFSSIKKSREHKKENNTQYFVLSLLLTSILLFLFFIKEGRNSVVILENIPQSMLTENATDTTHCKSNIHTY